MRGRVKKLKYLLVFSCFLFSVFLIYLFPVQAKGGPAALSYDPGQLPTLTDPLAGQSVTGLFSSLIKAILSITGSIALALFIYAGLKWMLARGNTEQTKSAAKIMLWSALGIFMIFGSYIILSLVFKAIK